MIIDNPLRSLPARIVSEDGIEYTISIWKPSAQMIRETWAQYEKYSVLFSDVVVDRFDRFFTMVMSPATVVLQVRDFDGEVGLIYGTEIRPGLSALGHYVFWGGKQAGKQKVVLYSMQLLMKELGIHRVNISIPMYAFSALHRVHRMGFRIEGRRREGILHKGRWADVLEFGVTIEELTDEAVENASLPRTDDQQNWHGLLQQNELLIKKILRVWNILDKREEYVYN